MQNRLSKERVGRITGSRIGAILGLEGAFKSKNAILLEMVREYYGEAKEETSPDLQRGIELEPLILKKAIKEYETPGFIKHKKYDFLGATPDAFFIDDVGKKVCVEVKAPRNFKEITPSYNAQMQLQMEVLDADVGLFVQGILINEELKVFKSLVERDREFIEKNIESLRTFMEDYERAKNNYFDLELESLSREYVALNAQAKAIQEKLSGIKEKLISKGTFENSFVKVIEKTRRGGIDFARFCKDNAFSIPLDYIREDTKFFEVRVNE
ncbi:lambda exonuclease family protein [Helicobacter sp.]|uniref:lambda exonuclease family protein n=1 Tax=Helicobacter sp. TaxID=218 RepID=UPI0025BD46E6|nr:lambda exonuclease family protein [Helicobacter sp.]MCI5969148.1 YqaJ viral recombinase family protein [Helicobacter sp.]